MYIIHSFHYVIIALLLPSYSSWNKTLYFVSTTTIWKKLTCFMKYLLAHHRFAWSSFWTFECQNGGLFTYFFLNDIRFWEMHVYYRSQGWIQWNVLMCNTKLLLFVENLRLQKRHKHCKSYYYEFILFYNVLVYW